MIRRHLIDVVAVSVAIGISQSARADDEWKQILQQSLGAEHSQTRQDGLKQVDTKSAEGLRALWQALSIRDANKVDWYVREGAHEALLAATGEEAEKEIDRLLKDSDPKYDLAREAVLYSIQWKIRSEVVKLHGGNDDRKINEAKYLLRKARGVDYFDLVLPAVKALDPEKKQLKRLQLALADKSTRVRRAAITGLTLYPDGTTIPLLIDNLRTLEKKKLKQKLYREWVLTRYALETLTGQYFRDQVEDWEKWWDIAKSKFSIEKLIEEEKGKTNDGSSKTVVVKKEGVQVEVHMKIAGPPDGYPLLVIPWEGYEVDYFRPYFYGVEDLLRVYYVRMPQIEDYKGLSRDTKSNLVKYPTKILAAGLIDIAKDSGLEKFGVLAHGPESGILAMTLAAENPGKVSHLVLINPRSSGDAYTNAIENVRRDGLVSGNKERVKGADSITLQADGVNTKYKASDEAEGSGLSRALNNLHFADPTEPETGNIRYFYSLPGGVGTLADDDWSVRKMFAGKALPQVLIFMGLKDAWTPLSDMKAVAGVFPRAVVAEMKESSELPFISEAAVFTQYMQSLFKNAKPANKEGENTKPKRKEAAKGSTKAGK